MVAGRLVAELAGLGELGQRFEFALVDLAHRLVDLVLQHPRLVGQHDLVPPQFEQVGAAGPRLVLVERLDQEVRGAGLERVVADLAVVDDGDHDDRHVDAVRQCPQLLDELDAVELGQLVIGEDDVDAIVAREFEGARRRVEELEVQLAVDLADDFGEQQPAAEQVVDDEDGIALRAGERELRGFGVYDVADLLKPADEAVGGLAGVGAVEVCGAQIVPFGAVAQHVPDGGEHRGGHGDDGLLGAAACTQAVELRLQVAAFDLDGGPGGLHEGGLEPLAAAAQPGAAALAGALVVARAQAGPGQQVAGVAKRDMSMPISATTTFALISLKPGHGAQQPGGLSKGLEPEAHLLLDGGDGLFSASMWSRCSLSMKRWCAVMRPRSASSTWRGWP